MGVFPFQAKTHMLEQGIEPGTSLLVVRNSDHQATELVTYYYLLKKEKPRKKIKILPYLAFIVVKDNCLTTNTLTKMYCGHERDMCTVCFSCFQLDTDRSYKQM